MSDPCISVWAWSARPRASAVNHCLSGFASARSVQAACSAQYPVFSVPLARCGQLPRAVSVQSGSCQSVSQSVSSSDPCPGQVGSTPGKRFCPLAIGNWQLPSCSALARATKSDGSSQRTRAPNLRHGMSGSAAHHACTDRESLEAIAKAALMEKCEPFQSGAAETG